MSCWSKHELGNMLEDVVNELHLSGWMVEEHGPKGTAPAELVRLVLEHEWTGQAVFKRGRQCGREEA